MRWPARSGHGWGFGVFSATQSVAQAWKSFALIALALSQVCDRSLRGGGRYPPGNAWLQSCPASNCIPAGECPLYARAIVILILFFCRAWQARLLSLPSSSVSVNEAAHTNVHYNPQRQKHKQDGRPAITH